MKTGLTDITVVLDESGSMADITNATLEGLNSYIKTQQNQPGDCVFSLTQFNTFVREIVVATPIPIIAPLTRETYRPSGGTALLDAIGQTIDRVGARLRALPESERPDKVVVVIVTDGEENASVEYISASWSLAIVKKSQRVFDMIKHQTEAFKWEFVFLGANQDAIETAAGLGIARDASLTYVATNLGVETAFNSAGAYTSSLRSVGTAAFTAEDRASSVGGGFPLAGPTSGTNNGVDMNGNI